MDLTGEVTYSREFFLEDLLNIDLSMPQSWLPYTVHINGHNLPLPNTGVAETYASQLIRIDPSFLNAGKNRLTLETKAFTPLLGGFKGGEILLTDNSDILKNIGIRNIFTNYYLHALIYFNILIAIICIIIATLSRPRRINYLLFACSLILSVGHHLLSTRIYQYLNVSPENVFKIVQASESFTFLAMTIFVGNFENKIPWLGSKYVIAGFLGYCGTLIAFGFLPFSTYVNITMFSFIFLSCMAPIFCKIYLKRTTFVVMYLAGYLLCILSLISDITSLNWFYLGYGVLISQLSGLYFIMIDMVKQFRYNDASKIVISSFVPVESVFPRLINLLESGVGPDLAMKALAGDGNVLTVFIDTIGSEARSEEIYCGLEKDSEQILFDRTESHFQKYGFEVIKPVGDMLHLAAKIAHLDNNSERLAVTRALQGLVDYFKEIDLINDTLLHKQLPRIALKIAASYGSASYGFYGSSKARKFDFRGTSVDYTARLESAITAETQKAYGENVLLVSNRLLRMCNDRDLAARFDLEVVTFIVKGRKYEANICRQYPDIKNVELNQLYLLGQFGSKSNPSFKEPKELIKHMDDF